MTTPSSMAPGTTIANRFRLDRLLGQGGMGSVWAAWHLTLNIEVAIKFIDPQYVSSRDAWSRFSHEAMAAAKIKSPHVVSVLDFGTDEYQRPYLAMELLQGEELASLLEREPTLPVPMVARIVMQACKGLARAHSAGVIHRDIKPDNLFLCEEDEDEGFLLKILDFGIAKIHGPGGMAMSTHRTGTGQVLGTPLYMSPEQAYGNRPVDHRSDLYSLAVVAYRCLTGRVPFHSDGVGELIVAITTHSARPPSHLRAGLPPGLDAWFQRALAKEPELRFRSAREMATSFAVACGLAPGADSTAQFSALTPADLAELTGPLSRPPGSTPSGFPGAYPLEQPSAVVPLVRRGNASPSSHPPSRRQAVTLQGTATSFLDTGSGPGRHRLLLAASASAAVAVGALLLWQSQSTSTPRAVTSAPLATETPAAPLTATTAAAPTTAAPAVVAPTAPASAASSAPVISITSLPTDSPRKPDGKAVGGRPVGKPAATPAATPAPTAPATTTAPAAPTALPMPNDYGL